MAFDYGSIDLGIKNPFKKEGLVTTIRGFIVFAMSMVLLVKAASIVKTDQVTGWILVFFGFVMLTGGIKTLYIGIMATLRYFVGRNHPTSLAYNHSQSEATTAAEEKGALAYNKQSLTEMLVGRKNATFVEPLGFLARFVHTTFPSLTYMPYPIRNLAQLMFGVWIKTAVALISFILVAFVTQAGFAGEMGRNAFPVYSFILALYLIIVWSSSGKSISRTAAKSIPSMGSNVLVKVIAGSLIIPVALGGLGAAAIKMANDQLESKVDVGDLISGPLSYLPDMNSFLYLIAVLVGGAISTVIVGTMLKKRMSYADPKVEVSELRDNWQESIHPKEIFINLDNLVMANRRYKEVPNRVYGALNPVLNEQSEGKGSFSGEMIQEIQPRAKDMDLGKAFDTFRMASLVAGNTLFVVSAILTFMLAFSFSDLSSVAGDIMNRGSAEFGSTEIAELSAFIGPILHLLLAGYLIRGFGRLLANSAHVFYAEMQFESDIIYFKCEGTFSESKVSTGSGIYDSTRSVNSVVRSSITPWIIVTRIVSSTFAATGMRNLEHPRFILEMHKADSELESIRLDVAAFLRDRENIASITSERDLKNASDIHSINQQSRAMPPSQPNTGIEHQDAEAAGYLRNEADMSLEDNKETIG